MQQVIETAIVFGGTTFDGHYVGVDGLAGGFQDELQVYGQENEACPNCGNDFKIKRTKLGREK
jgi:formamidopyrimidine-DNA glycosylase